MSDEDGGMEGLRQVCRGIRQLGVRRVNPQLPPATFHMGGMAVGATCAM